MSNTRAASSRSTPMAARKLVMSRNTMPVIDASTHRPSRRGDQPAAHIASTVITISTAETPTRINEVLRTPVRYPVAPAARTAKLRSRRGAAGPAVGPDRRSAAPYVAGERVPPSVAAALAVRGSDAPVRSRPPGARGAKVGQRVLLPQLSDRADSTPTVSRHHRGQCVAVALNCCRTASCAASSAVSASRCCCNAVSRASARSYSAAVADTLSRPAQPTGIGRDGRIVPLRS